MDINLNQVIDQVSKEKGIDLESLQETLEMAILQAAKKVFGAEREIEAQYNRDQGVVELFQIIRLAETIEEYVIHKKVGEIPDGVKEKN